MGQLLGKARGSAVPGSAAFATVACIVVSVRLCASPAACAGTRAAATAAVAATRKLLNAAPQAKEVRAWGCGRVRSGQGARA